MKNTQESLLWKYSPSTSEYPSMWPQKIRNGYLTFDIELFIQLEFGFSFVTTMCFFPSWRMCLIHSLNYRHPLLRDIIFQKTLDFKWEWIFWRNWNYKCLKFKNCGLFKFEKFLHDYVIYNMSSWGCTTKEMLLLNSEVFLCQNHKGSTILNILYKTGTNRGHLKEGSLN